MPYREAPHASLARRGRPRFRDLPGRLRRALILVHRWLGVALALVMAMWAASGIVMMYVPFPATSDAERVAGLEPLALAGCCPADRGVTGSVAGAAVEMLGGRAVLQRPGTAPVDLSSGAQVPIDARMAERVARTYLARAGGSAPQVRAHRIANDQWTMTGQFRAHAPLFRVAAADTAGTVLYVSGVSGQVVQDTTRVERFWNWFGVIPHWLYFKQLRENANIWSQVVIYISLLGTFLTAVGLYLGVVQLNRGRRLIPYRGMAWWHHVTGLVFGVFTLTWVASGLFSMQPWGLMESTGPEDELAALAGRPATDADIARLVGALAAAPPTGAVRAELAVQDRRAYAVLTAPGGERWRASLSGLAPSPPSLGELAELAHRARPGDAASSALIRDGDAYYYGHHEAVVLPAWRAIYGGHDPARLYFDPRTGELVASVDRAGEAFRWWHAALHRFDFAAALRARPVWDIVVLPLMLGVTLLCLIGLWLAGKRVWRSVAPRGKRISNDRARG